MGLKIMYKKKLKVLGFTASIVAGIITIFEFLLKIKLFRILANLLKLLITLSLPDLIWIISILFIVILLFFIDKKYKRRIKNLTILAENIKNDFERMKKSSFSRIDGEKYYKQLIIDAVHQANFSHYDGLYGSLEEEIRFRIVEKGKKFILIVHYLDPARTLNFPSEQIEKYLEESETSEVPYIIVTNASGLTQKAKQVLENFNRKLLKPKLFIVMGSDQNELVQEFKKIVG